MGGYTRVHACSCIGVVYLHAADGTMWQHKCSRQPAAAAERAYPCLFCMQQRCCSHLDAKQRAAQRHLAMACACLRHCCLCTACSGTLSKATGPSPPWKLSTLKCGSNLVCERGNMRLGPFVRASLTRCLGLIGAISFPCLIHLPAAPCGQIDRQASNRGLSGASLCLVFGASQRFACAHGRELLRLRTQAIPVGMLWDAKLACCVGVRACLWEQEGLMSIWMRASCRMYRLQLIHHFEWAGALPSEHSMHVITAKQRPKGCTYPLPHIVWGVSTCA